jgi:hypothetical protein
MGTMQRSTRHALPGILLYVLVIAAVLVACGTSKTVEAPIVSPPLALPANTPTVQPTVHPTVQATPTPYVLGPLIDPGLGLKAGPVFVPLEILIPSLRVKASILAVGLTAGNLMSAPKGSANDPVWHTAFWYRGGGIPGDVGTATIAGHVNDPNSKPEIFAHLEKLLPGDSIVIRYTNTNDEILFKVDEVKTYTVKQLSDPAILSLIFGSGPVAGTGPQPALDGLSHLTLITCAGTYVNGQFDHRTVVYATRTN